MVSDYTGKFDRLENNEYVLNVVVQRDNDYNGTDKILNIR